MANENELDNPDVESVEPPSDPAPTPQPHPGRVGGQTQGEARHYFLKIV